MTPLERSPASALAPQTGFSLVEVLVALIVLSVGLLGIAKMQALALASTTTSRMRSLAALEAASLASTMRADRAYWAAIIADPMVVITGATLTSAADSALTATPPPCDDPEVPCATSDIAAKDLQEWASDLSKQVPGETAQISCTKATSTQPTMCTIDISWKENQVASNAQQQAAAAAPATTTYRLYVEP